MQLGPSRFGPAQKALLDAMHVHVHGVGLVHAKHCRLRLQNRHTLQNFVLRPPLNVGNQCHALGKRLTQRGLIVGPAHA